MNKAKKFLVGLLAFASVSAFALGLTGCEDENPSAGTGTGNGTNTEQGGGLGGDSSNENNTEQDGNTGGENTEQDGGNTEQGGGNTEQGGENTEQGGNVHAHVFDQEVIAEEYLYSSATCMGMATYYKSCECGEKGTETFAYGEVLIEHVDNYDGTCAVCLSKYYSVGIEYVLSNDSTYYIVKGLGKCTETELLLLSKYNNLPVKEIGDRAFNRRSNLTSVTIPDSVTTIGNCAFLGCDNLTSVTIPDSVTTIGYWVFSGCLSLKNYNIKEKLQYLGNENNPYCYLYGVQDMTISNINIENACRIIGEDVFYGCSNLMSVTIPDSVTAIGESAFAGCSNLTSVYYTGDIASWCGITGLSTLLSNGIDNLYINNQLVSGCLVIPDGVDAIGDGAFYNCEKLTSVTIPDSLTTIGDYAFEDCSNLTSVTIGNSVTTIGDYAFSDCMKLTKITLPNSVTMIGDLAFSQCYALGIIRIPDSVNWIGRACFLWAEDLDIEFLDVSTWYSTENYENWEMKINGTQVSLATMKAELITANSDSYFYKM